MLNTLHRYQSSRPFSPIFSYIWNLMLDQILTQIISLLTTPEMADYDPAIFQELEPESFNTTLLEDKSVSRACERACERACVRTIGWRRVLRPRLVGVVWSSLRPPRPPAVGSHGPMKRSSAVAWPEPGMSAARPTRARARAGHLDRRVLQRPLPLLQVARAGAHQGGPRLQVRAVMNALPLFWSFSLARSL